MGYKLTWIYVWQTKVRPTEVLTENVIPLMSADSQDGYIATSSALLWTSDHPYDCFDGDILTRIHSINLWRWNWGYSQIQMPINVKVTKLTVTSRAEDRNRPQYPSEFYLEGSNDWTNWTNIWTTITPWFTAIGQTKSWDITWETDSYSYIKLNIQAGSTGYRAIAEWNIDWWVS